MLPPVGVRRCHLGGARAAEDPACDLSNEATFEPDVLAVPFPLVGLDGSGKSGLMSSSECWPPAATNPALVVRHAA